ncbi:MAG: amidohydrolase family protein [Bacteroidia bacterium]|nr:amidohydrolase family protein [Bacteroidia bacterium]
MRLKIVFFFVVFFFLKGHSQSILIKDIMVHNGKGDQPYVASILIQKNKIIKIQKESISVAADTIIDGKSWHIYPAIILCNNILGLQEAEAIRPTSDYNDIGKFNPHLRTLTSYNTDSKILPTAFSNGIMYTQCTPRGSYIAGTSSVVRIKAWNWEDAAIKEDGIHLYFPSVYVQKGWWAEPDKSEKSKDYENQLTEIKNFFNLSKSYYLSKDSMSFNPRYESMRNIWEGKTTLYIHCNRAKDILNAIQFAQDMQIPKIVLVGCDELYKVIDILKKYQCPVILSRPNSLPTNTDDKLKINFELPGWLEKNNILYCISAEGDMEAMQSRNLPFMAGMCIPYGLSKEDALKSITYNPAKILGIDNILGSIEENKLASLIISKGNILDPVTSQIECLILEGKIYSAKNFQNDLYEKYLQKYGLKAN